MPRRLLACLSPLALVWIVGCNDDTGEDDHEELPQCVELELADCTQLYPPTYDQVWNQTFANSCAEFGTACHASAGAAGAEHSGLTFVDPQATWELLVEGDHHGAFVIPGDPQCSPLFVRMAIDDPDLRMPPGSNGLNPAALCSIATWIQDGAEYVEP